MQGRSLLPFVFAGDERAPGRATFSQASYDAEFASEAVNFGRWKLVRESSSNAARQERPRFRLFDLSEDPEERVDRSNELPVSTRTLRQMLAWRRYTDARARAAREEPGPVDLDPELLEQMRALGYVP